MTVGDYTVRFDALKVTDDGQKQMVTGHITVLKDGKEFTKMYPARWSFRRHEDEPTSEVAIQRSFAEDLYIAMPNYNAAEQIAQCARHGESADQLALVRLRRRGRRNGNHAAARNGVRVRGAQAFRPVR